MGDRNDYAFIKLKLAQYGEEIHIDVSRIHALHRTKRAGMGEVTDIYLGPDGDNIFTVADTPDEIFAKIEAVFTKINARR